MAKNNKTGIPDSITKDLKLKGFKIHELPKTINQLVPVHGRRDFYKIGLVTGQMTLNYGGKVVNVSDTVLFFVNPNVPHTVVRHSKKRNGYACLFTEAFIAGRERTEILKSSPLFDANASPAIPLNKEQATFIEGIFQRMLAIYNSNYDYKNESLKSYIELLLHEALGIQPPPATMREKNGPSRITNLFMDALERQFPVESPQRPIKMRTPQDYADKLSVHTNYLNRSVKAVTGKPTSTHIAERVTAEAKALLLYTDWNVSDIAYGLGFEYPTYFSNYFKRVTGTTPKSLRKNKV